MLKIELWLRLFSNISGIVKIGIVKLIGYWRSYVNLLSKNLEMKKYAEKLSLFRIWVWVRKRRRKTRRINLKKRMLKKFRRKVKRRAKNSPSSPTKVSLLLMMRFWNWGQKLSKKLSNLQICSILSWLNPKLLKSLQKQRNQSTKTLYKK